MKKKLIAIAVLASSAIGVSAFAADGQVNFNGEIIDTACTVVNNTENPLNVQLGSVSRSAFPAAGDLSAATRFTLQLSDCPVTALTAKVKFDGASANGDNSELQLTQEPDVATGVAVQLADDAGAILPLYSESKAYALQSGAGVINSLDFAARYISTADDVTPGPANATASFTVIYN